MKRKYIIGSCFLVMVVICVIIFQSVFSAEAKERENKLNIEFSLISPFSGADLKSYISRHKVSRAFVEADYKTFVDFDIVKKHYSTELAKNGWNFIGEESEKVWGKDSGGKLVKYKKGDYNIELYYVGNQPGSDWTYSISIIWEKNKY